jgi:hypothetical protein
MMSAAAAETEARHMKGTPRSVWLSMANRVAGWWTSAAIAAMKRQNQAVLAELRKRAAGEKPKGASRRSPSKRRKK